MKATRSGTRAITVAFRPERSLLVREDLFQLDEVEEHLARFGPVRWPQYPRVMELVDDARRTAVPDP